MTDKHRFLVSRTFSLVTPESARDGDEAESGFVFDCQPMSLDEAVRELEGCVELSDSRTGPGTWAIGEPEIDYSDSSHVTESVQFLDMQGNRPTVATMRRLFKLAGLSAR
jgi:hypothetical protein